MTVTQRPKVIPNWANWVDQVLDLAARIDQMFALESAVAEYDKQKAAFQSASTR